MTAGLGRTIAYTSYNMPGEVVGVRLSGGSSSTYDYAYNAEHERTKLVHSTLGTFIYLHPAGTGQLLYERETAPGGTPRVEHKYYISAGGISVAVHYARENEITQPATETRYLHQDHLGSVTLVTNEVGAEVERLAYEPFGKRRFAAGTDDPNNTILPYLDRGFTSHEHLDEVALIHMNGRIYDPVLGRFITADPFLQDPSNLQSYNRYSYVLNNPLMYVDPSGYFSLKKVFKVVAVVAIAVITYNTLNSALWGMISSAGPPTQAAMFAAKVGAYAGAGFAAGTAMGLVNGSNLGQSLELGFRGAFAGAFLGGGTFLSAGSNAIQSAFIRGIAGGSASKSLGGNFGIGFKYAALASALKSGLDVIGNQLSSWDTTSTEVTVKPDPGLFGGTEIANRLNAQCGACAVIDKGVSNVGAAVTTKNPELVGRLVSSLTDIEKLQVDGLGRLTSEAGPLRFLSKMPGFPASSVFHDEALDAVMKRIGDGFVFQTINVMTIPPAFYLQYEALGLRSIRYYDRLGGDQLK